MTAEGTLFLALFIVVVVVVGGGLVFALIDVLLARFRQRHDGQQS